MAIRILIVHDEVHGRKVLRSAVAHLGCEIVGTADNAVDALRIAKQSRPDLVLVHMDRADDRTRDVIRELRLDHHLPVVSIGTTSDEEMLEKACSSGCIAYLVEPLRPHELDAAIQIALHQDLTTFKAFAGHSWMRAMFDSLSDGVIATNADGVVQFLNPAAQVLTGWMPFDAVGQPISRIYSLSGIETADVLSESQIHRVLASQEPTGKQRFLLTTRTGVQIPIEDSATPILDGTELVGAVTIFTNIAERIAEEQAASARQKQLRHEVKSSQQALSRSQDEIVSLASKLITFQEDERRRLARELHDDLAQRAALACQQLDRIAEVFQDSPTANPADFKLLKSMIAGLSDGLREAAHRLHPAIIEDLGLAPALRSLANDFRAFGLDLTDSIHDLPAGIPLPTATALYRIAQEALHNTFRHAPGAPARLTLKSDGDQIELRIEDAGPGFSLADVRQKPGLGLSSVKERAVLIGGSLVLTTRLGKGTAIVVTVPLKAHLAPATDLAPQSSSSDK